MSNSYWDRLLERRVSRRRALAATGATSFSAALLAACGGGDDGADLAIGDTSDSRKPGTVWFARDDYKLADETKIAVAGGIYRGVLAADQTGHYDAMTLPPSAVPFSKHVHEFLMAKNRGPGIDPKSPAASQPAAVLASSWELSPDGTTVTFTLRQNVKWHPIAPVNGRVMDIEDWKSSMDRHLATGPQRASILEVMDKVEYPDATHMVWKLKAPYGPLLERVWSERFSHVMLPKELNADIALAERTAIGTGYKILDVRQPSITMEYKRFDDYWAGKPFIDRWHAPVITEYANRYSQFVSGNIIDFVPTARDVLQLHKDAPQAVVVANPIPDDEASRMRFGLLAPKGVAWEDPRVRIAIQRSINFKGIGELLSNKANFEAEGIPVELAPMGHVPIHPGYYLNPEKGELGAVSENYLFNVAEAKKLIAAAGHSVVELPYYVLAAQGEVTEADQLVLDSLAAAGTFSLKVHRSQTSTEHRRYRSLLEQDGIVAQSSTSEDADYFVYRDYHSLGRVGSEGIERIPFPYPEIDKAAEAQRREIDPQKRFEHLKEFQLLAAKYMPAIPGRHHFTTFQFRWPWLRNSNNGQPVEVSIPDGRPIWGGHKQWLDADMPNREKGAT